MTVGSVRSVDMAGVEHRAVVPHGPAQGNPGLPENATSSTFPDTVFDVVDVVVSSSRELEPLAADKWMQTRMR